MYLGLSNCNREMSIFDWISPNQLTALEVEPKRTESGEGLEEGLGEGLGKPLLQNDVIKYH